MPNLAAVAKLQTALTRKDATTGGTVQFNWSVMVVKSALKRG